MGAGLPGISVTPDWLHGRPGDDRCGRCPVDAGRVGRRRPSSRGTCRARSRSIWTGISHARRSTGQAAIRLPSPASFARTMSGAGIGDDTPVVAYDDVGGWVAARLWWMLHVTGHPASLLDLPSLEAWTAAGHTLAQGPSGPRAPGTFTERPWPADRVVDADEVRAELSSGLGRRARREGGGALPR